MQCVRHATVQTGGTERVRITYRAHDTASAVLMFLGKFINSRDDTFINLPGLDLYRAQFIEAFRAINLQQTPL